MNVPSDISLVEAGAVLTIDLAALVANWRTLQVVCGDAECGAVVKADAYGLGLEPVVKALYAAGCKTFFVGHVFEGRTVRALAPDAIIYALNGLRPGAAQIYADFDVRPVLCSVPEVEDWGQFCANSGRRRPDGRLPGTALRLETGLNGLGFKPYDLDRAEQLAHLFDITLLLGQLTAAKPDEDSHVAQIDNFEAMHARFRTTPASIANSSAIFLEMNPLYDVVRPGYALYGGNPTPGRPNPMRPVVRLESQIIQLRILEPGEKVGEAQAWMAKGPRRIAIIAAGFADGLPMSLTRNEKYAGGTAMVQGKHCAFISEIAMDYAIVDVTDATYLERGEIIELIGESITIDDFAGQAGVTGYEILTHLGRQCHRRYVGM
jgi:alanine racemase